MSLSYIINSEERLAAEVKQEEEQKKYRAQQRAIIDQIGAKLMPGEQEVIINIPYLLLHYIT